TGDGVLDRLDALGIGVGVLADFDLKSAEAVAEPPFDLLLDLLRGGTVERREKRQFHLAVDPQERMVLQHLDRRQQGRCRNFTCVEVGSDHRLRLHRILADGGRGGLPAEIPAALARLAAGTGREMSLAPPQPTSWVSVGDAGDIFPWPQPIRPSASRASTMIGSNSVKVR